MKVETNFYAAGSSVLRRVRVPFSLARSTAAPAELTFDVDLFFGSVADALAAHATPDGKEVAFKLDASQGAFKPTVAAAAHELHKRLASMPFAQAYGASS